MVQGLLAQSYRFVVQARNEAGLSDRSVASSPIAVLATAPPPAPPASWAGIADADALAFGNTIIPRLGVKMHTTSAVTVTKVRARIDPVGATSITPTVGLASSLDASGVPTYISPVTGPASATVLANNWVEVTLTTPIALASGAVFYVLWDSTAGQIYGDAGGPAYTSAFQGAAVPELVVFDGSSNAQWGGSTDVYRIAMQVYAG